MPSCEVTYHKEDSTITMKALNGIRTVAMWTMQCVYKSEDDCEKVESALRKSK